MVPVASTSGCRIFMPSVHLDKPAASSSCIPIAPNVDKSRISSFFSVPSFKTSGYMTAMEKKDKVSPTSKPLGRDPVRR